MNNIEFGTDAVGSARHPRGESDAEQELPPSGPESPTEEAQLEEEIERSESEGMADPAVPVPTPEPLT